MYGRSLLYPHNRVNCCHTRFVVNLIMDRSRSIMQTTDRSSFWDRDISKGNQGRIRFCALILDFEKK